MRKHLLYILLILILASCSTTSNLPEGEVLYTGIKSIKVHDSKGTTAEEQALIEIEGALAYEPNGAFMGSSSARTPFPVGLWVYNAFVNDQSTPFKKWMFNAFSTTPITIAHVSPLTRTKVATNLLQNYGYFNGNVDYALVNQKNPRKQKITYNINLGEPYLYDSIRYVFPAIEDSIIKATQNEAYLKKGGQFSTLDLTNEKTRLVDAFHNNGFYFYRPDYINYFADSINHPKHVSLIVEQDAETPLNALHQYYIGNVNAYIRKSSNINAASRMASRTRMGFTNLINRDSLSVDSTQNSQRGTGSRRGVQYDDSLVLNGLKIAYQGNRMPIKPRVMFKNFKFWKGRMYNQSRVNQTITNLHNMNIFSNVRMSFTPRDTTDMCDTLDVRLDVTMDKLIDAELDFNITQKSNSQIGPHAGITFSKRNAFHHGETFSVGLKGSYEWQTLGNNGWRTDTGKRIDSYEAGIVTSLSYPWIAFPWLNKKIYKYPTSSSFSIDIDHLKRSSYFRTVTGEVDATYGFQTSRSWSHQLTPISIAYRKVLELSDTMQYMMDHNSVINASMKEQLIPAIKYAIVYDNTWNTRIRHTMHFEASVKESANGLNLVNSWLGFNYHQEDKKLLWTPYSQFLKAQFTLKNKFHLTRNTQLATRVQLGTIWSYGNSSYAPYSELFYVGGANSIRAFAVRSIGPGSFYDKQGYGSYVYQTGDFKLEVNAEYRFPIVNTLNGAFFVDAGNVWIMNTNSNTVQKGAQLSMRDFIDQLALGTGFGIRYDMEFLVLRLDLGIGIHAPYNTGKKSYYNISKFSEGVGLHFAVGYPF